jgi:hypothetical protein
LTARCAVLLLTSAAPEPPRPGIAAADWRAALAEDVADLLANLAEVESAVAVAHGDEEFAASLVWPGTPILGLPVARPVPALRAAAAAGYMEAAVLAADVPDLPALLVGKLFRGLGSHDVAVAPAAGGGLVALAARLPVPGWLAAADPHLDDANVDALRAAAPTRRSVTETPTWHRVRTSADATLLDPDLEGWEATRALLYD